jgi:hypothetical protein
MEEVKPDSGIKNYVISTRKAGFTDSQITDSLKKAGWPEDVILTAIKECSPLVPPLPDPKKEKKVEQTETVETTAVQDKKNDLFTKPEIYEKPQEVKNAEPKKEKKGFCVLALIALLFSPIPFVGLGIAMAALESAKKNKQTGGILAIIALLVNFGVICFIAYALYQIFTLTPDQLTGFSKYIVDTFKLAQ